MYAFHLICMFTVRCSLLSSSWLFLVCCAPCCLCTSWVGITVGIPARHPPSTTHHPPFTIHLPPSTIQYRATPGGEQTVWKHFHSSETQVFLAERQGTLGILISSLPSPPLPHLHLHYTYTVFTFSSIFHTLCTLIPILRSSIGMGRSRKGVVRLTYFCPSVLIPFLCCNELSSWCPVALQVSPGD